MVTKFEKRAVAWLLTVMMCLSVIFSGSTVAYAEDNGPVETAKGEAVKKIRTQKAARPRQEQRMRRKFPMQSRRK